MSNIITIEKLKGQEIYWYEDMLSNRFVVGIRGGAEYKIDRWDMMRGQDKFYLKNGRQWTWEEGFIWAYNYARRESEYVDFEEVPKEILFLNPSVSEIPGAIQNQTK